jgi:outer membrane immunogenic protein
MVRKYWQFSPLWVVGLEADLQQTLERDHATLTDPFSRTTSVPGFLITGTDVTDYTAKIVWFGTVRGRAGYVWRDGKVMSYLTGGLAYGKVDLEGTGTVSGGVCGTTNGTSCASNQTPTPFSVSHAIGHSHVNTGWVLGYGTEGVIDFWGARNWTWKIEGLSQRLELTVMRAPANERRGFYLVECNSSGSLAIFAAILRVEE